MTKPVNHIHWSALWMSKVMNVPQNAFSLDQTSTLHQGLSAEQEISNAWRVPHSHGNLYSEDPDHSSGTSSPGRAMNTPIWLWHCGRRVHVKSRVLISCSVSKEHTSNTVPLMKWKPCGTDAEVDGRRKESEHISIPKSIVRNWTRVCI